MQNATTIRYFKCKSSQTEKCYGLPATEKFVHNTVTDAVVVTSSLRHEMANRPIFLKYIHLKTLDFYFRMKDL